MTNKTNIGLIDVGNTKVLKAHYVDRDIKGIKKLSHALFIEQLNNKEYASLDRLVISSVVPDLDDQIKKALPQAEFLTHNTLPHMKINMKKPEQIGADRLVCAYAAYQRYQTSCLIVDAGTALTFCYIDKEGVYQGGAIFPGMGIASKSLNDYTAKIPLIYVSPKEELLGKTTKEAVQIGLYSGYYHLMKGMIEDYKKLDPDCKVIGTGSGIGLFENKLHLDEIDMNLILWGLATILDVT